MLCSHYLESYHLIIYNTRESHLKLLVVQLAGCITRPCHPEWGQFRQEEK